MLRMKYVRCVVKGMESVGEVRYLGCGECVRMCWGRTVGDVEDVGYTECVMDVVYW